MKKIFPLLILILFISYTSGYAQVTIGSEIAPTRGALLELRDQQTGSTGATGQATASNGGFLLPRVELETPASLMPFISDTDPDIAKLKKALIGLMVYNITYKESEGIAILYPALYTWNGQSWSTSQANNSTLAIAEQPKAFSFFENPAQTDAATDVTKLRFEIMGELPKDENVNAFRFQWYIVTGSNVHIRVGEKIGSAVETRDFFSELDLTTLNGDFKIFKGDTRNANNTGFYKFYCEVTELATNRKLVSETAEVAVGCGAKNNAGEWLSFMCFNLGADNDMTMDKQITHIFSPYSYDPNTNRHNYVDGEELVWGDLFQWGRAAS